MDFTTVNRAQLLLKVAALMEKRAGKGEAAKSVLEAGKQLLLHGAKSVHEVGKAGLAGFRAGAESLERAGHPILGFGMRATPWVGGAAVAKGGLDKYRQMQMERAYRRQMTGV